MGNEKGALYLNGSRETAVHGVVGEEVPATDGMQERTEVNVRYGSLLRRRTRTEGEYCTALSRDGKPRVTTARTLPVSGATGSRIHRFALLKAWNFGPINDLSCFYARIPLALS